MGMGAPSGCAPKVPRGLPRFLFAGTSARLSLLLLSTTIFLIFGADTCTDALGLCAFGLLDAIDFWDFFAFLLAFLFVFLLVFLLVFFAAFLFVFFIHTTFCFSGENLLPVNQVLKIFLKIASRYFEKVDI